MITTGQQQPEVSVTRRVMAAAPCGLVQVIHLQWTKSARGGQEACARNAVPQAFDVAADHQEFIRLDRPDRAVRLYLTLRCFSEYTTADPFPHSFPEAVVRTHILFVLGAGLLIAADAKDADVAKKELKKLSGSYVMASGESRAEKLSEERIKEATMTIEGDKYTARFGGAAVMGTLKVDPSKTPKEIDATDSEGKTILGIYQFDKDQFTVCFAPPGKERPKEFSIKAGTGDFIHVWKKKAKE
jgi:uncharacterized protein (TIGR03067 family)